MIRVEGSGDLTEVAMIANDITVARKDLSLGQLMELRNQVETRIREIVGKDGRELRELSEVSAARELAQRFDNALDYLREGNPTHAAQILRDLADKTEAFQRLWIDAVENVRESEVTPWRERAQALRRLVEGDMTVERMEEALRLHYGEVVRPVSVYCNAFRSWASALHQRVKELQAEGFEHTPTCGIREDQRWCDCDCGADERERKHIEWSEIIEHINALYPLPIMKSNLLFRLIYLGETLRTEKCPTHQGHWMGCVLPRECACQDLQAGGWDSNVTGWLP